MFTLPHYLHTHAKVPLSRTLACVLCVTQYAQERASFIFPIRSNVSILSTGFSPNIVQTIQRTSPQNITILSLFSQPSSPHVTCCYSHADSRFHFTAQRLAATRKMWLSVCFWPWVITPLLYHYPCWVCHYPCMLGLSLPLHVGSVITPACWVCHYPCMLGLSLLVITCMLGLSLRLHVGSIIIHACWVCHYACMLGLSLPLHVGSVITPAGSIITPAGSVITPCMLGLSLPLHVGSIITPACWICHYPCMLGLSLPLLGLSLPLHVGSVITPACWVCHYPCMLGLLLPLHVGSAITPAGRVLSVGVFSEAGNCCTCIQELPQQHGEFIPASTSATDGSRSKHVGPCPQVFGVHDAIQIIQTSRSTAQPQSQVAG